MRAFVTGATGFVGSHVARQLHMAGADLRLLVRAGSRTENISDLPAERVVGDLTEPSFLRQAFGGCEFVFHVAADYRLWTARPQEMYRTNVEGTRSVIRAAQEAGVRRVICTSSLATMRFTRDGDFSDEDTPVALADMVGHYRRSKFLAEQVALEAGRGGANVVVANPSSPIGERDIKPTPTGRMVVDFLRRRFPVYMDTILNFVDVLEVARGHLAVMEKGKPGERYILGGENLKLKEFLDRMAAITGLAAPRVKVPFPVAYVMGAADTFVRGTVLSREPLIPLEAVRIARTPMRASSAKAERELGWRLVPIDDALRRAIVWFRSNGYA
jgi:dihydroflavonol-4-reductase